MGILWLDTIKFINQYFLKRSSKGVLAKGDKQLSPSAFLKC